MSAPVYEGGSAKAGAFEKPVTNGRANVAPLRRVPAQDATSQRGTVRADALRLDVRDGADAGRRMARVDGAASAHVAAAKSVPAQSTSVRSLSASGQRFPMQDRDTSTDRMTSVARTSGQNLVPVRVRTLGLLRQTARRDETTSHDTTGHETTSNETAAHVTAAKESVRRSPQASQLSASRPLGADPRTSRMQSALHMGDRAIRLLSDVVVITIASPVLLIWWGVGRIRRVWLSNSPQR